MTALVEPCPGRVDNGSRIAMRIGAEAVPGYDSGCPTRDFGCDRQCSLTGGFNQMCPVDHPDG